MSLLDFIDSFKVLKQTNSYIWIECPICGGTLGISKRNGAYKCWSNECSNKSIWSEIAKTEYRSEPLKIEIPIPRVQLPQKISFILLNNYQPSKSKEYYSSRFNEQIRETNYYYDQTHKVIRYELLDRKLKIFNPSHLIGNKWVIGSDSDWLFYNEQFINKDGNMIIMAEGEKTAESICQIGYACLSAPGFSSKNWLEVSMRRIYPWIDGILYWSDNDDVGARKADHVQQSAWKANLGCEIIIHPKVNDAADLNSVDRLNWLNTQLETKSWTNLTNI